MRGSPHVHCLLWVNDSPKINEDPDEVVCQFIPEQQIPEPMHANEIDIKLMKQLQKHVHSYYCQQNYSCQFGFPKPPSTQTLIA